MNSPSFPTRAGVPLRVFGLRPVVLACLSALPFVLPFAFSATAHAQSAADTATLSPVVITANPLGSDALASPTSVLKARRWTCGAAPIWAKR